MKNKVILKIALVLLMTTLMVSMFGEIIPVHAKVDLAPVPVIFSEGGSGGGSGSGSGGSSGGSSGSSGGGRSCGKC